MPEPSDSLNDVLGDMAERIAKYADVWQDAARKNAHNDYSPTDAVHDLQHTFTMGLRDAAEVGAALLAAFSRVARPPADERDAPAKKAAAKKTAAKKAVAKKAPAKKQPGPRRRPQ